MLAVRWLEPFRDVDWGFEIKWDGVRTVLYADAAGIRLRSRMGNDTTSTYPELAGFAPGRRVILDGEVVALDSAGRPSFERLQRRMNVSAPAQVASIAGDVPVSYVVFDVLFDEQPLLDLPWRTRRERLRDFAVAPPLVPSQTVDGDPSTMWDFVRERGIEGIVGKRLDSAYRPGVRSPDWRKITVFRTMRALVVGYTTGDGARSDSFGALVLGLRDGAAMRWVGSVGSGFKDAELRAIRVALDEMTSPEPPFAERIQLLRPVTWVHPQLVAMVQYKEWTSAGRLRAPSFKGFTDDAPDTVTWDSEGPDAPG